jgi:hypothetical protein
MTFILLYLITFVVEAKMLFGNIFDYELDHRKNWVVFEADYEFKLLVMNGKKGENMDFLKFCIICYKEWIKEYVNKNLMKSKSFEVRISFLCRMIWFNWQN